MIASLGWEFDGHLLGIRAYQDNLAAINDTSWGNNSFSYTQI